jgi:hypothetical protein
VKYKPARPVVPWAPAVMGRRSPVLGYNHNVRYRGLVFHVQTEDSGIVNPHLFTHLFHGGVIVSTRKLVYDPDADDGVVKSLMQAQHKAVMKELRRGLFDDKIDQNLKGTPGLLARGASEDSPTDDAGASPPVRPSAPSAADQRALDMIVDPGSQPVVTIVPELNSGGVPQPVDARRDEITLTADAEPSEPEIEVTLHPNLTPPGIPVLEVLPETTVPSAPPAEAVPVARVTGKRSSTPPPMSSASLPPLPRGGSPAQPQRPPQAGRPQASIQAPQVFTRPVGSGDRPPPRTEVSQALEQLDLEDQDQVEIHSPAPGSAAAPPGAAERASEYIHRRGERGMRDEVNTGRMQQLDRTAPVAAPPSPPPAPAAAKKPGSQPGFDATAVPLKKSASQPGFDATAVPPKKTGSQSGLERGGAQPPPTPAGRPPPEPPASASGTRPGAPSAAAGARPAGGPPPHASRDRGAPPLPLDPRGETARLPQQGADQIRAAPSGAAQPATPTTPSGRKRTPTAPRFPATGAGARPAAGQPRSRTGSAGGVVMSRPAVIVGGRSQNPTPAPQPTAPATPSNASASQSGLGPEVARTQTGGARVRRAREDVGGRGVFGQDLISEKSLDEVILAYLSEDASED